METIATTELAPCNNWAVVCLFYKCMMCVFHVVALLWTYSKNIFVISHEKPYFRNEWRECLPERTNCKNLELPENHSIKEWSTFWVEARSFNVPQLPRSHSRMNACRWVPSLVCWAEISKMTVSDTSSYRFSQLILWISLSRFCIVSWYATCCNCSYAHISCCLSALHSIRPPLRTFFVICLLLFIRSKWLSTLFPPQSAASSWGIVPISLYDRIPRPKPV